MTSLFKVLEKMAYEDELCAKSKSSAVLLSIVFPVSQ